MYETLRIVTKILPKFVIWENVSNVLSDKHKHNFHKYLNYLKNLGYHNYYSVLNSKDYGIPQSRERLFVVSVRSEIVEEFGGYVFPKKRDLKITCRDLLEPSVPKNFYITEREVDSLYTSTFRTSTYQFRVIQEDCVRTLLARDCHGPKLIIAGVFEGGKWDKNLEQNKRVYNPDGLAPTLHTCIGGNTHAKIIESRNSQNIRRLTPREYWRLMGFDDSDFDKAQNAPTSNSQLYKQAGNSIVVNVLEAIFAELYRCYPTHFTGGNERLEQTLEDNDNSGDYTLF